jgi:hypothetical protein
MQRSAACSHQSGPNGSKRRASASMSTSAISSGSSYLQTLLQSRQDLQTLQTDVGSGNIAGAKADFASFQQDAMNMFQSSKGKQSGQTGATQTTADLQALQSALSSGNVTGTQKALASFQQDLQTQSQGKTHKHHHHHHQKDTNSNQTANATATNATATNANGGVPNSAMTLASLLSAYQAFNSSSAATTGTALSVLG